jgi:hypothetical protein
MQKLLVIYEEGTEWLSKEYLEKGWQIVSVTDAVPIEPNALETGIQSNFACWVVIEKKES